jgi:hypothetical protein
LPIVSAAWEELSASALGVHELRSVEDVHDGRDHASPSVYHHEVVWLTV